MRESNFHRSIDTITKVIKGEGKKRESKIRNEEYKYHRESTVLTPEVLKLVKRRFSVKNPQTIREVANELNIPRSTVHYGLTKKLEMKKKMKTNVHIISQKDIENRKKNSRKLYENLLCGTKSQFVVTLDEAYIQVRQRGRERSHYYINVNKKRSENVPTPVNENFPEHFMIVGAMCQSRTFPLMKVPKKVKYKSQFYVDHVLRPLIEDHLVPHFGSDINKVTIHHDKATSHTSGFTTKFLEEMKQKHGISYMKKEDIPVKGPDISPLDFFGFGFLKHAVAKSKARTETGVWKKLNEVWDQVSSDLCRSTFDSWKRRCVQVRMQGGHHIEHIYSIHSRKNKK